MPVDYTGALIALAVWIGGLWLGWRRAARIVRERPDRSFHTIFWTVWLGVALTAFAIFIVWFYDWVRGRA